MDKVCADTKRGLISKDTPLKKMSETLLPELNDPEALKALAEVVAALLDQWRVHEVNQAALLKVTNRHVSL